MFVIYYLSYREVMGLQSCNKSLDFYLETFIIDIVLKADRESHPVCFLEESLTNTHRQACWFSLFKYERNFYDIYIEKNLGRDQPRQSCI